MEQINEKNMERQLDEMAHDIKKIKRRLLIMAVGSYARLIFFLIPLILAAVYLPPLLRDFWRAERSVGSANALDVLLKQLNR